jgi:hypothetical protein
MLVHQSITKSEILPDYLHKIYTIANNNVKGQISLPKLISTSLRDSLKKDVLRRNYCEDSGFSAYILYVIISNNNRIICFKRMSVIHMIYVIYTKMFAKLLRRADFKISALNSKDIVRY